MPTCKNSRCCISLCDECGCCEDHCSCWTCEGCDGRFYEEDWQCSNCNLCESCCECSECQNCGGRYSSDDENFCDAHSGYYCKECCPKCKAEREEADNDPEDSEGQKKSAYIRDHPNATQVRIGGSADAWLCGACGYHNCKCKEPVNMFGTTEAQFREANPDTREVKLVDGLWVYVDGPADDLGDPGPP